MAAPGSELRELAERLLVGASNAVGAARVDEARAVAEELAGRWRGDAIRISEKTRVSLAGVFRELGLVTRDDLDELELRVAQLEHRLRLVEKDPV
jgi:polyhydroxyalkanoate synthesis regulator phasin